MNLLNSLNAFRKAECDSLKNAGCEVEYKELQLSDIVWFALDNAMSLPKSNLLDTTISNFNLEKQGLRLAVHTKESIFFWKSGKDYEEKEVEIWTEILLPTKLQTEINSVMRQFEEMGKEERNKSEEWKELEQRMLDLNS